MKTRNTTPVRQDVRELTVSEIETVAGGTGNGTGNTITIQPHIAACSFGHSGSGGSGGAGILGGTGGAGGRGGCAY